MELRMLERTVEAELYAGLSTVWKLRGAAL
jgi:hypothetical protein